MLRQAHPKVQVSRRASSHACLAPPCDPQLLPFPYPCGYLDLVPLGLGHLACARTSVAHLPPALSCSATFLARRAMPHLDQPHRPAHRFLEGYHDVAFNVSASLGAQIPFRKPSTLSKIRRGTPASRAKNLLEKITETRAAKLEFE